MNRKYYLQYINNSYESILISDDLKLIIEKIDLMTQAFKGTSFIAMLNDFQIISSQGLNDAEFDKTVYANKFNFPIEIYNMLLDKYNLVIIWLYIITLYVS